ncbi:MAG: LysR family transcriptional regulator [Alphaproteobacteria bacterium]|nr:LysR family transcriptional regulator [Alphaproteobacteria bacterium]
MGRPDLEDLRVWAAVARSGSLTAAGRELGMPKQTVSRRVSALEEALGVRLLHRGARVSAPTPIGTAFAERCAEVVRVAEEAEALVAQRSAEPTGVLRVTATEAVGEGYVAPVVARLLERWPRLSVEVLLVERRVDLVAEGIDVAVRVGRLDDVSLIGTRVAPATVRYCASPAYLDAHGTPTEPEDLRGHRCLAHASERRLSRWPFAGPGGLRLLDLEPRLAINHVGSLLAACRAGAGVALLPAFLVAEDLSTGRLRSVLDAYVPDLGHVWLLTPSRRWLAPAVRAFLDEARTAWPG